MYYYGRLNELDGLLFCSFSVMCSLSNVDDPFFVLFFTKVIYWYDAPVDQLPLCNYCVNKF